MRLRPRTLHPGCQHFRTAFLSIIVVPAGTSFNIKALSLGRRLGLSLREKRRYTVIVQDNGVGISPEDRPHVFERFYTADKAHTSGKGTGLGLSICQRIMEMHGQKITLMDTGDEAGAAFAFTLDCAK